LAARIGGEEFAILLTETNLGGALEVAERLRLAIKGIKVPPVAQIAASFGVAECPLSGQTTRELLAAVDAALYEAKRQGRDRVVQAPATESNSEEMMNVQ
jgi:diguanylate cyclase (GGDEF)-like protein